MYDRRSAFGVRSFAMARPGGAVGAALPCALDPAPRFSRPNVTAFRAGRRAGPGREEDYYKCEMIPANETHGCLSKFWRRGSESVTVRDSLPSR